MSTKYKNSRDVPTEAIIARLKELSDAVTCGHESQKREFTMRIPAECDRDADLVIAEAARRLKQAQARVEEFEGAISSFKFCHPSDEDRLADVVCEMVDEDHSTGAWLLRKQAEAVEAAATCFGGRDYAEVRLGLYEQSQRLRQQADQLENGDETAQP